MEKIRGQGTASSGQGLVSGQRSAVSGQGSDGIVHRDAEAYALGHLEGVEAGGTADSADHADHAEARRRGSRRAA
jgi:hypothetical protein